MTNSKITLGTLVRLCDSHKGSNMASILSDFAKQYGDGIGIVVKDHDNHVFVLFSNGNKKYIHKTFLKPLE